jgi:two-component system sensor histidine kinase MtrB
MRRLASLWRRSIQLRVVTSTVALATVFISATTWAVAVDVIDSLEESRRTSAINEARVALAEAQFRLDAPEAAGRAAQDRILQRLVDAGDR